MFRLVGVLVPLSRCGRAERYCVAPWGLGDPPSIVSQEEPSEPDPATPGSLLPLKHLATGHGDSSQFSSPSLGRLGEGRRRPDGRVHCTPSYLVGLRPLLSLSIVSSRLGASYPPGYYVLLNAPTIYIDTRSVSCVRVGETISYKCSEV